MISSERGSALIEAILLGLVLIVPVMWMLGLLSEVHRGSLAATAAVREAGVEAARAGSLQEASEAVTSAVQHAFGDHGLDASAAEIRWTSDLDRDGAVEVVIEYPVPALSIPFVGDVGGPQVWVRARHAASVDPFGSRDG